MNSDYVLSLILGSHGLLVLSALLYANVSKRRIDAFYYLWMLLLPVFGPLSGWLMLRAIGKMPQKIEMIHRRDDERESPLPSLPAAEMVPLEEALLINDPRQRRTLMMQVLRSDPMQYLDLLLIARFNEDSETAHYATATIMELRRYFHLGLHEKLKELTQNETDIKMQREYADLLHVYCQSGLLEGSLLKSQRINLKKALGKCLMHMEDPQVLSMMVQNSLALNDIDEARAAAKRLLINWPLEENSWLEGMRVCVETCDQSCMITLLENMGNTSVDFTGKGRRQLLFWGEKKHEE
ncbi:MAG: hypothetical protein GX781_09535 [Clostridiales bacterium]|nr:hypothetical protein [Clostridiales bacterium]